MPKHLNQKYSSFHSVILSFLSLLLFLPLFLNEPCEFVFSPQPEDSSPASSCKTCRTSRCLSAFSHLVACSSVAVRPLGPWKCEFFCRVLQRNKPLSSVSFFFLVSPQRRTRRATSCCLLCVSVFCCRWIGRCQCFVYFSTYRWNKKTSQMTVVELSSSAVSNYHHYHY